jgi:hypothetical protein
LTHYLRLARRRTISIHLISMRTRSRFQSEFSKRALLLMRIELHHEILVLCTRWSRSISRVNINAGFGIPRLRAELGSPTCRTSSAASRGTRLAKQGRGKAYETHSCNERGYWRSKRMCLGDSVVPPQVSGCSDVIK